MMNKLLSRRTEYSVCLNFQRILKKPDTIHPHTKQTKFKLLTSTSLQPCNCNAALTNSTQVNGIQRMGRWRLALSALGLLGVWYNPQPWWDIQVQMWIGLFSHPSLGHNGHCRKRYQYLLQNYHTALQATGVSRLIIFIRQRQRPFVHDRKLCAVFPFCTGEGCFKVMLTQHDSEHQTGQLLFKSCWKEHPTLKHKPHTYKWNSLGDG